MTTIDPRLFARLQKKLNLADKGLYSRIERVSRREHLPTRLAAIKLAMDVGMGVKWYSSEEDLRQIRGQPPLPAPPSTAAAASAASGPVAARGRRTKAAARPKRGTSVFVVHGRDDAIRVSMFTLLRAFGLKPIEWSKARKLTKKPNPHISEILDAAFSNATAVLVLFTPDELVRQKKKFIRANDPVHEREQAEQSRPNVLFESGMAMGRDPNRTVLVEIGTVRPFSDVAGRHLLRFDGSVSSRQDLADRLDSAGCEIDRDGHDWHTAGGTFSVA